MTEQKKLGRAQASTTQYFINEGNPLYNSGRQYIPGYYDGSTKLGDYHKDIKQCRWFYTFDPIAGTVVNRMADMAITSIKNERKTKLNADSVDDPVLAFFDSIIDKLRPFLKMMALEYLLHGMVVPEYTYERIRGDLLSERLGRKRYSIPVSFWIRNPDNIRLKRRPTGTDRQVWLIIPKDDIELVMHKGIRSDGTEDKEAYEFLVDNFPEYVAAIRAGRTKFLLEDVRTIMRKIVSYDDYPTPFLRNALGALKHKAYLKKMDYSIAGRAIEAIRLFKTGDKDFPADDDDIKALEVKVTQTTSSGEYIYNLFANHTVEGEWIFPPLETLMSEEKYAEPNADIFLGLGFPRILTTGETLRSNSSDSKIAALGPKATLDDLRDAIIVWLKELYKEIAEKNNITRIPEPYFSPIITSDYTALVQFAIQALQAGAISKNTVAQLYGSDYETEANQIESEIERGVPSPAELQMQKQQEFQKESMQLQQDFQDKQSDKQVQRDKQSQNTKQGKSE